MFKQVVFGAVAAALLGSAAVAAPSGLELNPLGIPSTNYSIDGDFQRVSADTHFNHPGGQAVVSYDEAKDTGVRFQHEKPFNIRISPVWGKGHAYSYGNEPRLVKQYESPGTFNDLDVNVSVYKEQGWHVTSVRSHGPTIDDKEQIKTQQNHAVHGVWRDTGYTYYFTEAVK